MVTRAHGRSILLVQGDADSAQSLSAMLVSMGHQVKLAVSAELARELASETKPVLVAPIVMMSGLVSEVDKRRSFDAGCDYHLVKPLDLRHLANLVTST